VQTREGQEVELESYGQLQPDGKLQKGISNPNSTQVLARAAASFFSGFD